MFCTIDANTYLIRYFLVYKFSVQVWSQFFRLIFCPVNGLLYFRTKIFGVLF